MQEQQHDGFIRKRAFLSQIKETQDIDTKRKIRKAMTDQDAKLLQK